MASLERYLPQLFGLVVSVEENQKLRLNSPLAFSWSSAFANKPTFVTCYTYRFELVMVLICYALAHVNRALDSLSLSSDGSFDEDSKRAANYLRQAAGIFEYVQTRELPRWLELPKDRPLEVNSNVCQALSDYCVATAQALTVKKAVISGTTSKQVLSKLAVDVWNKYTAVENIFKGLPGYKDVNPTWRAFLTVAQGIAKATTYKFMGQVAYEQGKYGNAVSTLNAASDAIKVVWTPSNSGLLVKNKPEINAAIEDIEHVKRTYTTENNNIYFQPLVPENQLEIPEAKSLLSSTPWIPPQPAYKSLV